MANSFKSYNCQYYFDLNTKTTVAVKTYPSRYEELVKNCKKDYIDIIEAAESDTIYECEISLPRESKGVTRCEDGDKFDAIIGKDVAALKADIKFHRKSIKYYDKIINKLSDTILALNRCRNKHYDLLRKLESVYTDKYCNKPSNK